MLNKKEWVFKKAKDELPVGAIVVESVVTKSSTPDPLSQLKPLTNLLPKQSL